MNSILVSLSPYKGAIDALDGCGRGHWLVAVEVLFVIPC
jgi:hypothetical protein